jgi:hypothetical protein
MENANFSYVFNNLEEMAESLIYRRLFKTAEYAIRSMQGFALDSWEDSLIDTKMLEDCNKRTRLLIERISVSE